MKTNKSQVIKFSIVGVINTLVDLGIFTSLRLAGSSLLLSNTLSTSAALATSLALNNKYTFKERVLTLHKGILYIVVTLLGIWVLQPIVIKLLLVLHEKVAYASFLSDIASESMLLTVLPKIISIVVTVIWNYLWYSHVIFPRNSNNGQLQTQ